MMFVPRALRLKGVSEDTQKKAARPERAIQSHSADGVSTKTATDASHEAHATPTVKVVSNDMKETCSALKTSDASTVAEPDARVLSGIELIFSDYAHQEESRLKWLQEHYRTVDGGEEYIHLASILEHPYISGLKPTPTQPNVRHTLKTLPSDILELSPSGHHVRRKPSTYPPRFLPSNSFSIVNDDGLTFWDQRTIYVEPHVRSLCQQPARVAHWLREHGQLKAKWLPIQAVHTLWNSCAFVVLSGNVTHEDVWDKWRKLDRPEHWKIMTKVEHTKRTREYLALLKRENPEGMRKVKVEDDELPAIARPAALPMDFKVRLDDGSEAMDTQSKSKRKRKKSKRKRSEGQAAKTDINTDVNMNEEDHNESQHESDTPQIKRVAG